MNHDTETCPVCGYLDQGQGDDWPWPGNTPSFEICPCCGTQFGYDDAIFDDPEKRALRHAELREAWRSRGCPWWSSSRLHKPGWDAVSQVKAAGI